MRQASYNDQALQANPPSDPAFTQRVQSLRDEGQNLQNEGKHQEFMARLGEAMELLEEGRCPSAYNELKPVVRA